MFAGISLPYKGEALAAEIILIFILAGLEAVRIFLGMYNKSFFLDCAGQTYILFRLLTFSLTV